MLRPRFVIADPYLAGYRGHAFEYCTSTAFAAKTIGFEPIVLGHCDYAGHFPSTNVEVLPWFGLKACGGDSHSGNSIARDDEDRWWHRSRVGLLDYLGRAVVPPYAQAALRSGMHRAIALAQSLSVRWRSSSTKPRWAPKFFKSDKLAFGPRLIKAIEHYDLTASDHVFLPTLFMDEIASMHWALSQEYLNRASWPKIHIVLRRDPREQFVDRDRHPIVPPIKRLIPDILTPRRSTDCVAYYADTIELASLYQTMGAKRVGVLPIPVRCAKIERAARASNQHGSPRVIFLGEARVEKGFHYLPAVVEHLRPHFPDIEYVFQSYGDTRDPVIQRAIRDLGRLGVMLVSDPLTTEEYYALLASADVLLLPYDPKLYLFRSSGVLAEALAAACPCVVPGDTWMAGQITRSKTGTVGSGPRMFAEAARLLLSDLDSYRARAIAYSDQWRAENTADALVRILVADGAVNA